MKIIPLFYIRKSGKVAVHWCQNCLTKEYNSSWWSEETNDPVIFQLHTDLVEHEASFDSLEEAHNHVSAYYQTGKFNK